MKWKIYQNFDQLKVKALTEVFDKEVPAEFWLAGHSFGGYLAARMCMEENNRIAGVILLDPWGFKNLDESMEEKLARLALWKRSE